ncbi:RHS repeat domain-containing protein [Pirellulaceae bacterium SH467]
MLETSPDLRSARPCTGEPSTTFGCTEASTTVWRCFDVHSINASVGPSPDEATTATWRYQSNQQYRITAVTTSSGSVAERYAYTAYGQPTILDASGSVLSSSAINNRYTYTGREWDQTLGLYHFRARWASGLAGRFMGRDPIGYEGSEWGLYELLDSKTLRDSDPSGHDRCIAYTNESGLSGDNHANLVVNRCDDQGNIIGSYVFQSGAAYDFDNAIMNTCNKGCRWAGVLLFLPTGWNQIESDYYPAGTLPSKNQCSKVVRSTCEQDANLIESLQEEIRRRDGKIPFNFFNTCERYVWERIFDFSDYSECMLACCGTKSCLASQLRICGRECESRKKIVHLDRAKPSLTK